MSPTLLDQHQRPARERALSAEGRVLLRDFDVEALEASSAVIFAVNRSGRIVYFNPAYERFAKDNGGGVDFAQKWGLGACYFDAIGEPLRGYYVRRFEDVLRSEKIWTQRYFCNAPDKQRRDFLQWFPSRGGILMVHSGRWSAAHDNAVDAPMALDEGAEAAAVVMCMHCRRTRRGDDPGRWDMVEAYLVSPPTAASYSLCPPCRAHYFGP